MVLQNGGSGVSVLGLGCKEVGTGCLQVLKNLKRLDDSKARLEGVLAFPYQELNQSLPVGFAELTPDQFSKRNSGLEPLKLEPLEARTLKFT